MAVAIILKTPELTEKISEQKVIYADAAYKFADGLKDKTVLGVVGDFDSLGFEPQKEKLVRLEVEKNFTDGERAVHFAKECGENEIVIYGANGGRLEHILGNIALLKIAQKIGVQAKLKTDGNFAELVGKGKKVLQVKKGGKVSFIPYGGDCKFVKSEGLYYPLESLTLTPADTRGISNVAVNGEISFEISGGESLIIYEYEN